MKKITMRLFALALLTMVSMGAWAQIDVQIAKDGTFDGGTIKYEDQTKPDEKGFVTVTITVIPDKKNGYTISKNDITVVSTYPPTGLNSGTRTPEIAETLTLYYNGSEKEDIKDLSVEREYTFKVPSGFGAWVKEAEFKLDGSKGGGNRGVPDYSGTYYIKSGSASNESSGDYYLCPTEGWAFYVADNSVTGTDNGKPFLTTYHCKTNSYHNGDASDAVWIIEKAPAPNDAYYYIKQASTGRYIVANGSMCNNPDRMRVHLEEINDPNDLDDNALFSIYIPSKKSYFVIKPIGITDNTNPHSGHTNHKWLVVNQGNKDHLDGTNARTDGPSNFKNTGGIICIYTENDNNVPFYLEIPSPVISQDPTSLNISMACEFTTGVTIRYTIDGTEPTSSSTLYEGEFLPGIWTSVVKAKAFNSSGDVASATTSFELPKNATPSISVDMSTSPKTFSISSTVEGGTIYYTINGKDPTESSSTPYDGNPITFSKVTTVKAVVVKEGYGLSEIARKDIIKVGTPQFSDNGDLTIVIASSTPGASIYYTIDGSTPSRNSSLYSIPLTGMEGKTIKAIAVKSECFDSDVSSFGPVSFSCAQPLIKRTGLNRFTLTCSRPSSGVTIYYTTDGNTPSTNDSHVVSGGSVSFETSQLPLTVKAMAVADGFSNSPVATLIISNDDMSGSGTPSDPYQIALDSDFSKFITMTNGDHSSASFIVTNDINASGAAEITTPFTGTFDGDGYTISNLGHALFNSVDGGTVKNVILDAVSISGGTNAGAIANKVTGTSNNIASIYNCGVLSGSIDGSGYVGSIVGQLGETNSADDCYARVINCFSYAAVSGGSDAGGIVGYNCFASTAANLRSMVMNCMFYGDIKNGTNVSPVYGGETINNLQGGLSNFNYYAYTQLTTATITKYNCALAVEDKYLTRFEYYRLLLNSNKKLAAFYATGSPDNADQMAKWVLETADRTINDPKPYPVLKAQGYYPSIINPDFENAPSAESAGRNKGGKLGTTLTVTIDGVGTNAPSGASITKGSLTLQRTDKDFDRFNFNYDKVQLPYYNEVGTGNYTGNKVVTGWKITAITPVEGDPYSSANYPTTGVTDYPDHNYADRKSSNKDLYSVSKRVFSQGAYFDVPYGVTSITIEPYWGNAIYVADQYYDVVYKVDYSGKQGVSQTGTQVDNSTLFNGQSVKSSITGLGSGTTVYDNAVVLVGNFHLDGVPSGGSIPFTMMSVDEDNDHEPDYSLIYHHKDRTAIAPIRFDFLNIPGTAQAQKPNGASKICNFTIFKTKGWFEVTNTSSFYTSQLEYENQQSVTKSDAPLILLGGVIDQFVSTQSSAVDGHTIYIHVGGNVWINEFGMGTHSDGSQSTPHVPVSVTGGEFPGFYLTGTYKADAQVRTDNAECYISGGYFHEAAGASLEQIDGDVHWQIYNADIDNFFGGGINDAKPITGSITTDIYNSYVTLFCGGPKFGNMQGDKKVITNAEGCTFGKYFGAGFGGTSIAKKKYYDKDGDQNWNTLQGYYTTDRGKYFNGSSTQSSQTGKDYGKKGPGVATDFDYEFFVWTSGATGARFYVKFVSFSLAQCNDVESNLKGCTINENFYGGGSLGSVRGKATSVLEDCTVQGNVFGGGYSATKPTVQVRDGGFTQNPNFNASSGMFEPAVLSGTTKFEWKNASEAGVTLSNGNSGSDLTNHYLYTNTDLSALGQVAKTDLTIKGNTIVRGIVDGNVVGGVFGGGDESKTLETTTVDIQAGSVSRVFGGGNKAAIVGNTTVQINGGSIVKDVYGGGKEGDVGGNATLTVKGGVIGTAAEKGGVHGGGYGEQTHVSGDVEVNIGIKTGAGTQQDPYEYVGSAEIYGDVYGGSAFGTVNSGLTNTTKVNLFKGVIHGDAYGGGLGQIGRAAQDAVGTEGEEGYQPAVTEIKAIAAQVKGVVTVTLDGAQFDITNGEDDLVPANTLPVSGRIFGCNNLNGSPEGDVFVNILRTVPYGVHQRTAEEDLNKEDATHTYELAAVYGGGNLAAYLPNGPAATAENNDYKHTEYKATITINGCDKVSIKQVYGGGNAASTPAALVNVKGTYEIEELFGGGNGMDRIQKNGKWYANPGANMGFLEYADDAEDARTPADRANNYGYGDGKTEVNIFGGRIHRVFGGANTKGNVRQIALTILEDKNQCTFMVDEAYGGGKSASMDGAAELKMACIPGLKAAYGGAQEADINNDVTLNITNGTFDRVFGGNNKSGHITGTITVNIEETGCKPVIIGQVYGGGNLAPYTAPSGKPGPTVNVKSFTSIGEVYGGGFGAPATVTGDTHVNINEVILSKDDTHQATDYSKQNFTVTDAIRKAVTSATLYPRPADSTNGSIGVIGNIYGGGNEAQVIGNTYVNIGNLQKVEINTLDKVEGNFQKKPVVGADIRGNVYGGGNKAEVTGNTNVVVGKSSE